MHLYFSAPDIMLNIHWKKIVKPVQHCLNNSCVGATTRVALPCIAHAYAVAICGQCPVEVPFFLNPFIHLNGMTVNSLALDQECRVICQLLLIWYTDNTFSSQCLNAILSLGLIHASFDTPTYIYNG